MEQSDFSGSATRGTSDATSGRSADGDGLADRAHELADSAQDKLADAGSTVRERASHLKATVADALESGADKLRHRVGSDGQLAGATGTGIAALDEGRLAHAGDSVATGMKATANWLRDADLDGLKTGLERQVKEHPGRTLLIAAGVGYLIGKALRK